MKKFIIIFILAIALNVNATTIIPYPEKPNLLSRIFTNLWNCKLDIGCYGEQKFGTTITDISTGTKFQDFPAIYNANNLALNNGKIEVSTTTLPLLTTLSGLTTAGSLATVGTLTSGALGTGFTLVGIAQGGTGSSTLAFGQVLLGSTTNAIGIVEGYGTSGDSLVSQGSGLPPIWSAVGVNENNNYLWTGNHNFIGSTYIKSLYASSTVYFNNIDYSFPASEGAASSTLSTDGAGNLAWVNSDWSLLSATTTEQAMDQATTTIAAADDIRVELYVPGLTAQTGADQLAIKFNDLTPTGGSPYMATIQTSAGSTWTGVQINTNAGIQLEIEGASTTPKYFNINIHNDGTATTTNLTWSGTAGDDTSSASPLTIITGSGRWYSNSTNAITTITVSTMAQTNTIKAGTKIVVFGRKR